jgi:hypothetical protein
VTHGASGVSIGVTVNLKPHPQIKNETGKKYGRLFVESLGVIKKRKAYWKCVCDCGKHCQICGTSLRNGMTQSCGCWRQDTAALRAYKHGSAITESTEYRSWKHAKNRCQNSKNKAFKYYGARGIKICNRWNHSFENFLKDMGKKPTGKSLDRKNNNGNYTPKNCRWATPYEQSNNSRHCRIIKYGGISKTLKGWADWSGINIRTLHSRLKNKTIGMALNTPVRK